MSEEKPELMALDWKLYDHALRLAEELEEPGLSEKERRWRYDALSKVASQLVKLLQLAAEEGEVKEDDLVKLLSGLSEKGLMSSDFVETLGFEKTERFLKACKEWALRNGKNEMVREFEEILTDMRVLEARVKAMLKCREKFAEKDFGG